MMSSSAGGEPAALAPSRGAFLLVSCQSGAEAAVAARMHQILPGSRRAAWRRGVVTFRLPDGLEVAADLDWPLVFATAVIRCHGQVAAGAPAERIAEALERAGNRPWNNVHVWKRDPRITGDLAPLRSAFVSACGLPGDVPAVATAGDEVLDVMLDSETRWWVGSHRATSPSSCWPGGRYPLELPAEKVSRAWLKLDEAIASFGIPFTPGQRACELGAAPGGSCLRLLEAGLAVVGVDPAIVAERVASQPRFTHWRMRSRDVRLRAFRGFDWIVSDMNIAPERTLEALARIVTADGVRPRGIVATLKLPRWSDADSLPRWLDLFRGWGFEPRCRQLSTGGREVCVVASAGRRRRDTTDGPRRARPRPGR